MPRKKTTPTVATTEPDTNLNPDRAQVAAVADLPHAPRIVVDSIPEGAPVTVARVEQVIPSGAKVPSREWVDQCEAKIAEQDAALQAIARVVGMVSAGDLAEVVARVRTIAEQSARIALMDVERANHRKEIEMWMNAVQKVTAERDERDARIAGLEANLATGGTLRAYLRALTYPASVAENLEMARDRLTDEDRALVHSLTEDEVGLRDYLRVAAHPDVTPATIDAHYRRLSQADSEVVTRYCVAIAADAIRTYAESHAPTPHDHAAGYLAITSGNVRAARWKRNILHDIRDPDMVIGQIDHLTDGWAPSVKGAAAPPMKTEAEARAWCEARCGWTVVQ